MFVNFYFYYLVNLKHINYAIINVHKIRLSIFIENCYILYETHKFTLDGFSKM